MLVKIEEIQEPGLELKEPIKAEVLTEALSDAPGYELVSSRPLSASFKRVSGQVHLKGAFGATVKAPCRRCLKPVTLDVPVEFALRMVPEGRRRDEDEDDELEAAKGSGRGRRKGKKDDDGQAPVAASFELDEIDAEPFDGKTIDLDPVIREQVLLALPVTVLCREDCKGLCPTCGQDLNEQDCGHGKEKEVDVRLAKLKDIKLKN
ncbi:MAG: DUF177 domain-containing protein [Myxococcota bacterium]|jgi:uncharacterized protein